MANTEQVTAGKPAVGGAVYRAPLGTSLPTSVNDSITGFTCMGYISDAGLTNSNSPSTETVKAWGGDTVLTILSEREDTFTFKLLEVMDVEVLKAVYGADNVTGTLATGITVRANVSTAPAACWVFDMVLTDGALKRIVVPNANVTELGDIVYRDSEAIGYEVTITAKPGDSSFDYDTHKEYIKAS